MRKTVLLVNQLFYPHRGGVENSLDYMARAFAVLGFEPVIVCSALPGSDGKPLPLREVMGGVEVRRYPLRKRRGLLALWAPFEEMRSSRRLLRELARERDVALVVARHYLPGLSCLRVFSQVTSLYVIPGIMRTQNSSALLNRSGSSIRRLVRATYSGLVLLPLHARLQAHFATNADRCVVFSENMRRQVAEMLGCRDTVKIPPGVDVQRFAPSGRQFAGAGQEIVCLILGRLNPAKSVEIAVRAINQLRRERAVRLEIVGSGPERGILEQLVKELGCEAWVRFHDSTSQAEQYYKKADLFLMTSRYEPFGQTILEAMSSGLPVIGFRADPDRGVVVANDEIIQDGQTGFLCDFGVDGLIKALRRYSGLNADAKRAMSEQARNQAVQRYSWSRMCRDLLGLVRG